MFLSTIQPIVVWKEIETKGVYRADEAQIEMLPDFEHAYRWLVEQMEIKIGPRPEGVTWPVWAWYMHRNRKGRLDLRREENWCDEPSVCIECEIPDDQVVLSDLLHGIVSSIGRRVFWSKSSTRHWIWSLSVRATK